MSEVDLTRIVAYFKLESQPHSYMISIKTWPGDHIPELLIARLRTDFEGLITLKSFKNKPSHFYIKPTITKISQFKHWTKLMDERCESLR